MCVCVCLPMCVCVRACVCVRVETKTKKKIARLTFLRDKARIEQAIASVKQVFVFVFVFVCVRKLYYIAVIVAVI
jgi:hypothetical protein